jgi:hypothetical protein
MGCQGSPRMYKSIQFMLDTKTLLPLSMRAVIDHNMYLSSAIQLCFHGTGNSSVCLGCWS